MGTRLQGGDRSSIPTKYELSRISPRNIGAWTYLDSVVGALGTYVIRVETSHTVSRQRTTRNKNVLVPVRRTSAVSWGAMGREWRLLWQRGVMRRSTQEIRTRV
jgi:hypothetical protein